MNKNWYDNQIEYLKLLDWCGDQQMEIRKKLKKWVELSPFGLASLDDDYSIEDLKEIIKILKIIKAKYDKLEKGVKDE